jgi:hypothetical protein
LRLLWFATLGGIAIKAKFDFKNKGYQQKSKWVD